MTYEETLAFLLSKLPMFQRQGATAFKKDLTNTIALLNRLGNPQASFPSVHIAGTNGKGSSAHAIASVLQEAGYKTGLYTSPHLKEYTERIKINGQEIDQQSVVTFVQHINDTIESVKPSFFEVTVAMAFWYFAQQKVDIAVIETGMGGRLDSTNVLLPEICLITRIGMDHMQFLGDTLEAIAGEKAGIIKPAIPVVIGENNPTIHHVFESKSNLEGSPISFAQYQWKIAGTKQEPDGKYYLAKRDNQEQMHLFFGLGGLYQRQNLSGILETLFQLKEKGWNITSEALLGGLRNVVANTGLKGRWQILKRNPLVIADVGHNEDGIKAIVQQASSLQASTTIAVVGMTEEKASLVEKGLWPKHWVYHLCSPDNPRCIPANMLVALFQKNGYLNSRGFSSVTEALAAAEKNCPSDGLILLTGSTFVVAEGL